MLVIDPVNEFTKQPAESYTRAIDFTGKLPTGATLQSGTVQAIDLSGADVSGTVLSGTSAVISGNEARIKVLAGVHGQDYRIRFVMTLTNTDVLEEDMLMHVLNR